MNINYKTDNPIYAPGLSTYSTKGNRGKTGAAGTSLYYAPLIINNDYAVDFVNDKIKSNAVISNDTMEYLPEGRIYKAGDLIIDQIGNVFRIKLLNTSLFIDTIKLGNITDSIKKNYTYDASVGGYVFYTSNYDEFAYEYDCIYKDENDDVKIQYNVNITPEETIGEVSKYKIETPTGTTHIQTRDVNNGTMIIFPINII